MDIKRQTQVANAVGDYDVMDCSAGIAYTRERSKRMPPRWRV